MRVVVVDESNVIMVNGEGKGVLFTTDLTLVMNHPKRSANVYFLSEEEVREYKQTDTGSER